MFKVGDLVADPFGREEYVTITGHDSVKGTYQAQTKSGKPMSFSKGSIEVTAGAKTTPKITKATPKGTDAPISFIGTSLPPLGTPATKAPEQQQQKPAEAPQDPVAKAINDDSSKWSSYQKALAGAEFFVDIMNAQSAYASTTGQARLNILQARNQAADAIYRGRIAQGDRQSEGYAAGNNAKLAMAAQGQDVNEFATEKLSGSFEAVGYENGAREMINAYREALGYELEEVNYEYQIDQAGIKRTNDMIGATLNFGTKMAVL